MDSEITSYRVQQCSKCPEDTEYYCVSCPCDMCLKCKENHEKDLKTIDHDIKTYCEKMNCPLLQEICVKHSRINYKKYCEFCSLPICYHCRKHRKHKTINIRKAFLTKRQEHKGTIHTIRSETLFYRTVLMTQIKTDAKTCQAKMSRYQSEMTIKAQILNGLIDYVLYDLLENVFCDFDFKHRCLKQRTEIYSYILSLEIYVHRYEQSSSNWLQFLLSIKTALHQIHLTPHTSQLSMTEALNKEDVMESLSAIQIKEGGHRRLGNESMLKLMSAPEFHQFLTVKDGYLCFHISCMTPDRVWVSDFAHSLILTNTKDENLHSSKKLCKSMQGSHTVNSKNELIYIGRKYNINKLSHNMKTTTTFIKRTDSTWKPQCLFWSPSTGDLLVAMYRKEGFYRRKIKTFEVTRYNQSGQLKTTIQLENTGMGPYCEPFYITENINGDVVMSYVNKDLAYGGVVVTERGGRHRFSYIKHPSGSELNPRGICTDVLSHILVCDHATDTVQMLNRDGQFLSHLLIRPSGLFDPYSLCYDPNTHLLWVGSIFLTKVCAYRYLDRKDSPTDLHQVTETGQSHQEEECLILLSTPELLHSLTVTGVGRCLHICCMTTDRVWVSEKNNLLLTNTTGDTLHRVEDAHSDFRADYGLHTVNGDGELIYIDGNYNINKLSRDMQETKTFVAEKMVNALEPQCVYWSPSTGDLLVGMSIKGQWEGMLTRYNQSGQLTQAIYRDNTGQELYISPIFITENNNGDIVVSDLGLISGAVVVTDRGGQYRFSYTGYPSGSNLSPRGICTDALSHILVCDSTSKTVQMFDRNGQFLSYILKESTEMAYPYSLSYIVNTHSVMVGSKEKNTICVYKYITRQDTRDTTMDEHTPCSDGNIFSSTSAVE